MAGANDNGQLGMGTVERFGDDPTELLDARPAIELGAGRALRTASVQSLAVGHSHVCAILDNYRVKCWGSNDFGQLGLGDTDHRGDAAGEPGDALPPLELL